MRKIGLVCGFGLVGLWACTAQAPPPATSAATDSSVGGDLTPVGDGALGGGGDATSADGTSAGKDAATPGDSAAASDAASGGDTAAGKDTASATDAVAASCPQAAALLDMTTAVGAGDTYAKPQLAGKCENGQFVVTSNGMPSYQFVPMTPNALKPQAHAWKITTSPVAAAQTTAIPELGLVGFSVAGLPFYGPNEGGQPTAEAYGDPIYNGITDGCNGHTAQNGDYHNHALQTKCLTQAAVSTKTPWTLAAEDGSKPSPIVGFALDGFAIYGPWGCTDAACAKPVKFHSGYKKTGDPKTYAWKAYTYTANAADATVLDACNGRVGPDGSYRYHATEGFPYILGCYKGSATGAGAGNPVGGGTTGPQSCTADADCIGAKCPQGSKAGCKCAQVPDQTSKVCVPQCKANADCPAPPGQAGKCMTAQGICEKPAGGGPPP